MVDSPCCISKYSTNMMSLSFFPLSFPIRKFQWCFILFASIHPWVCCRFSLRGDGHRRRVWSGCHLSSRFKALPSQVGHEFDLHRLEKGYPLIIGRISILHDRGCEAHFDRGCSTSLCGWCHFGCLGASWYWTYLSRFKSQIEGCSVIFFFFGQRTCLNWALNSRRTYCRRNYWKIDGQFLRRARAIGGFVCHNRTFLGNGLCDCVALTPNTKWVEPICIRVAYGRATYAQASGPIWKEGFRKRGQKDFWKRVWK